MINRVLFIIMLVAGLGAPFYAYPVFVMDLLCFALFIHSTFNRRIKP